MYQALYRKYRPRRFGDVAGQEHVTETLRRQIVGDRLSHAYLFVGTRGTGKTTCAKLLSRAVNCQSPEDGEPCNKCASCVGIENGSILDVLELDAASNNGVDSVRALREEAIYTPAYVNKRVYIVDEVHMLSNAAFNALLKILEEPPEHLVFILATTELHKVPATILSRCQRFSFKRLSPAAISKRLDIIAENEGLTLTADASEKLAALADGSMRDGISLLDQCATDTVVDMKRVLDTLGLVGQQELKRLAVAIADGDIAGALGILDSLYDDGRDMASLLNELATLTRDLLVFRLSQDSPLLSGGYSRKELTGLSRKLVPERLFFFLEAIKEAIFALSRGGGVKLPVEMCLIRMCDERLSDDPAAALARIAKLEAGVQFTIHNSQFTIDDKEPRDEIIGESEGSMNEVADDPAGEGPATEAGEEQELPPSPPIDPPPPSPPIDPPPTKNTDFWQDILDLLKGDIPVHALLSDSTNVKAELREDMLIIRAASPFTVNTIESKMFSGPLREAATKALGREVAIRVETGIGGNGENKRDKLERLSKFDIVKFE